MTKQRLTTLYVAADLIGGVIAWSLFFFLRKVYLDPLATGMPAAPLADANYWLGLAVLPVCWCLAFLAIGGYNDVFRRFRTKELGQTLVVTLLGTLILFFVLVLDDAIIDRTGYLRSFLLLFCVHFVVFFVLRFAITSATVRRVHDRRIGFNTLLVGGNERAVAIHREIEDLSQSPGNRFIGFVSMNGRDQQLAESGLPFLGKWQDLPRMIADHAVEEVIIAVESNEHGHMSNLVNLLAGTQVRINIIPDIYDIMAGSVKMTSIFGAPLIAVNPQIMPAWQFAVKRAMDVVISLFALVLLVPVYLTLAVLVRLSSPGPIFFRQERIGLRGKPFRIIKFRSMYADAEKAGPQLSSEEDPRITPIGRTMRRTRLDELPQFWNVLKGEMSLVGPRPERQHFIDRIMEVAPHYRHLHKVRPGITSWGQVKFGYAENVEQMVRRLKYDILYIENMSVAVDLKILAYTVLIVLRRDGK